MQGENQEILFQLRSCVLIAHSIGKIAVFFVNLRLIFIMKTLNTLDE